MKYSITIYSNSDVIDSCCCCYGNTNLRILVSGSLDLWLCHLQFLIAWEQIDLYSRMLSAKQIPSLKATTDVWLEGSGQVQARKLNLNLSSVII